MPWHPDQGTLADPQNMLMPSTMWKCAPIYLNEHISPKFLPRASAYSALRGYLCWKPTQWVHPVAGSYIQVQHFILDHALC